MKEKSFAISVCQQGDRLANHRPDIRGNKFSPTPFSIVLLSSEGELIEAGFDQRSQFLYSLTLSRAILDKGNYIVIVDAIWD